MSFLTLDRMHDLVDGVHESTQRGAKPYYFLTNCIIQDVGLFQWQILNPECIIYNYNKMLNVLCPPNHKILAEKGNMWYARWIRCIYALKMFSWFF